MGSGAFPGMYPLQKALRDERAALKQRRGQVTQVWLDELSDIPEETWVSLNTNRVRQILETVQYFHSTGVNRRRAKLLSGTHLTTQRDMQEQRMYSERYGLGVRV